MAGNNDGNEDPVAQALRELTIEAREAREAAARESQLLYNRIAQLIRNDAQSFPLSGLNSDQCTAVLQSLNLTRISSIFDFSPFELVPSPDPFEWENEPENSPKNRREYMKYISDVLQIKQADRSENLHIIDVFSNSSLLNVTLQGDIRLRGGTDVIVYRSNTHTDCANCAVVVIELKKTALDCASKMNQAVGQLLSAVAISQFPALSVLTDLEDHWTFHW
ncbi:hypothetical protein HK405_005441, partial [Cladochytrium tenue]